MRTHFCKPGSCVEGPTLPTVFLEHAILAMDDDNTVILAGGRHMVPDSNITDDRTPHGIT